MLNDLLYRLRSLLRREKVESETDEELRFHYENQIQKLVASLRELNLELADLFPPLLRISETPTVARELLVQLRLLQSTLQVKLNQFDRKRGRFSHATLRMHGR